MSEMAAEEQEDEGQEDVLALTDVPVVSASPRTDRGEAGEPEEDAVEEKPDAVELDPVEPEPVEMGERGGGRTAGKITADWPGVMAGKDPPDGDGGTAAELWKDGPMWTVRSGPAEIEDVQRLALAERVERAADALSAARAGEAGAEAPAETAGPDAVPDGLEQAARMRTAGMAADGMRRTAAAVESGLEGLYRQTVQAVRPAAPAVAPEQAGRMVQAQEPGSAASLAVDELDRAVRRDSRRYDGGLSIF